MEAEHGKLWVANTSPDHFSVATPPSCPNAHLLSARGRSGVTVADSNTDPPGLGMLTLPFSLLQHQLGTEHSAVCAAMTISFWKEEILALRWYFWT